MTGAADRQPLHITADLRLDVDGVRAQITGDGQLLTVTSDHPLRLLANALGAGAVTPSSKRRAASTTMAALQDAGVSVSLAGPRGELGRVGASGVRLKGRPLVALASAAAVLVAIPLAARRRHR